MMLSDIASRLRRDADYLAEMHRETHPGAKVVEPWYVETMREAADELDRRKEGADGERHP